MMQTISETLHKNLKIQQKLFCCLYGLLAELLEGLHKFKSGLACACTCCFVTLCYLSLSVGLEKLNVCIDKIYKFFHNINNYIVSVCSLFIESQVIKKKYSKQIFLVKKRKFLKIA